MIGYCLDVDLYTQLKIFIVYFVFTLNFYIPNKSTFCSNVWFRFILIFCLVSFDSVQFCFVQYDSIPKKSSKECTRTPTRQLKAILSTYWENSPNQLQQYLITCDSLQTTLSTMGFHILYFCFVPMFGFISLGSFRVLVTFRFVSYFTGTY